MGATRASLDMRATRATLLLLLLGPALAEGAGPLKRALGQISELTTVQRESTPSPCSSADTSCLLKVLALKGLIKGKQGRMGRGQEVGEGRGEEQEPRGVARYQPDCWGQDWPGRGRGRRSIEAGSRERRGTYYHSSTEASHAEAGGGRQTTRLN